VPSPVALLIGAVINLPGPFYLLALGKIARGDYSTVGQVGLILLFIAIMFLLLEVRSSATWSARGDGKAGYGHVAVAEREGSEDHGLAVSLGGASLSAHRLRR
jgi:hypothetical protein